MCMDEPSDNLPDCTKVLGDAPCPAYQKLATDLERCRDGNLNPTKTYETLELELPVDVLDFIEQKAEMCDLTTEQMIRAIIALNLDRFIANMIENKEDRYAKE